jgi:hypothetical protein
MLDRIDRPDQPIRDVLLHGDLVVRASCGATEAAGAASGSPA